MQKTSCIGQLYLKSAVRLFIIIYVDISYGYDKLMDRRTEKQDNSIYDDIVYTYKVMDDAPYELDDVKLRSMQKMERALHFILNNIKADSISVKETAKQAGYSEAYFIKAFKMYFGMPFQKYIDKLKLRKAASEIQQRNYPKQISSEYGYSSVQSFSKAFKREIGISPRYFFTRSYTIPDMPFRNDVMGVNISLEYREEKALSVSGVSYLPPRGEDTYFMDSYALPFAISKTVAADEQADDKVGIWWYGLNEGMKYVYGSVKKYYDSVYVSSQNASDNEIVIQGGNYAVFSYPRPEDAMKIHLFSRIMARFIFKEWVPVNEKVTNTIGYTYEKFTKTRVYIYLPLATGMGGTEEIKPKKWSTPSWAKYIDSHIDEQLSLESLAIIAGYSPQNYRDIFTMYYGITPTEYIRRRRESLALISDSNDQRIEQTDDLSSYDLDAFYEKNNAKVKLATTTIKDTYVVLHSIEEARGEEIPADLIGRVFYWFHNSFRDFRNIDELIRKPETKISIWGEEAVYENENMIYKYYVGSLLSQNISDEELKSVTDNTTAIIDVIKGGKYAVFQTLDEQDEDKPELAYHLLTLTAFGGWINENRWRVDLNRRTFVTWKRHKLHFYVPIVR